MASGKTPLTDKVNELRKKHGLFCATNPTGARSPAADATVEDRAAYWRRLTAYRAELAPEVRKLREQGVGAPLDPAARRGYHAALRARQRAIAAARLAAAPKADETRNPE